MPQTPLQELCPTAVQQSTDCQHSLADCVSDQPPQETRWTRIFLEAYARLAHARNFEQEVGAGARSCGQRRHQTYRSEAD